MDVSTLIAAGRSPTPSRALPGGGGGGRLDASLSPSCEPRESSVCPTRPVEVSRCHHRPSKEEVSKGDCLGTPVEQVGAGRPATPLSASPRLPLARTLLGAVSLEVR